MMKRKQPLVVAKRGRIQTLAEHEAKLVIGGGATLQTVLTNVPRVVDGGTDDA